MGLLQPSEVILKNCDPKTSIVVLYGIVKEIEHLLSSKVRQYFNDLLNDKEKCRELCLEKHDPLILRFPTVVSELRIFDAEVLRVLIYIKDKLIEVRVDDYIDTMFLVSSTKPSKTRSSKIFSFCDPKCIEKAAVVVSEYKDLIGKE